MKYLVLVFLLLSGITYSADTNTTVSSTVTGTTTVDKTPSTATNKCNDI